MKSKYKVAVSALAFTLLTLQSGVASAMKCGTHIISAGQENSPGQYEVLKRCGEPDSRQGNTWIYERGSVTRTIRFDRNGRILEIR